MKKVLKYSAIILIVVAAVVSFMHLHDHKSGADESKTSSKSSASSSSSGASNLTAGFNKSQYSLTDPTSIWVIVNKQHPLNPVSFVPPDLVVPNVPLRVPGNETMQLRSVTATALEQMFAAAKSQGINLMLSSGYRSFSYQQGLYESYVQTQGQSTADMESARAGYSEHQTGLAADVEPVTRNCELEQCFGTTPEGEWVAANCYKYGFIVRYTTGNEAVTGYEPEPWHIRYVGVELSTEMHKTGIQTLEQFFGVSGGSVYKPLPTN